MPVVWNVCVLEFLIVKETNVKEKQVEPQQTEPAMEERPHEAGQAVSGDTDHDTSGIRAERINEGER